MKLLPDLEVIVGMIDSVYSSLANGDEDWRRVFLLLFNSSDYGAIV